MNSWNKDKISRGVEDFEGFLSEQQFVHWHNTFAQHRLPDMVGKGGFWYCSAPERRKRNAWKEKYDISAPAASILIQQE